MICGLCMISNDTIFEPYVVFSLNDSDSVGKKEKECILNIEDNEAGPSKKRKFSDDTVMELICKKPSLKNKMYVKNTATFWAEGWRSNLCQCKSCIKLYHENKVEFIIDEEDSVHSYEEKGKNNIRPTEFESSMAALTTLPRANQIDAITGYNNMKQKLFEFLQTFVTNNTIVTEQDISQFFRMMTDKPNKVEKPPHFCR